MPRRSPASRRRVAGPSRRLRESRPPRSHWAAASSGRRTWSATARRTRVGVAALDPSTLTDAPPPRAGRDRPGSPGRPPGPLRRRRRLGRRAGRPSSKTGSAHAPGLGRPSGSERRRALAAGLGLDLGQRRARRAAHRPRDAEGDAADPARHAGRGADRGRSLVGVGGRSACRDGLADPAGASPANTHGRCGPFGERARLRRRSALGRERRRRQGLSHRCGDGGRPELRARQRAGRRLRRRRRASGQR